MRTLTLRQAEEKAGCEAAREARGETGPGSAALAGHHGHYMLHNWCLHQMNHCTFPVILLCRRGLTENAQNYGQIRSAQHSAGGRQTGCFDCIVHIWQQNSNNFGRWSSE